MAIIIYADTCIGCGSCADACPLGAITVEGVAVVDEDICAECGACTGACPVDAITL